MVKRLRQWLDFSLLYLLYLAARPLPRAALLAMGRGLGTLVWRVLGYRRAVVLDNLRHAFAPELDEKAIRALAHRFYRNLGMTLMEFLAMPRLSPDDVVDLVDMEGAEHLETLRDHGRGAILVSGHFGNWELLGARIAAGGARVNFIIKTQHNLRVDRMQNAIRDQAGLGVIRAGAPIKEMIRALRRGEYIGMLADQDAGDGGVFVSFLGREASAFRGAAYLAWKLDVPLLTGFIFRRPGGHHLVRLDAPVFPDPEGGEEEEVRRLTEHHVRRLEAAVREAPDHFFWVHRRWKTRPPEESP